MSSRVTRAITPNALSRLLAERIRSQLSLVVRPGTRLLVAVSGGADSIAVAHLLKALPYPFVIGHVHHGLRAEASRDERFVRSFAERWDLPFYGARVNVRSYASEQSIGIEEAARHLRYQALIAIARRHRCKAIVTAHHADDQAETVFMNFLRGAGPSGLGGIAPSRKLTSSLLLLRPALQTSRSEFRAYLKTNRIAFRTDASNRDQAFLRNRIRRSTLPVLDKSHPGLPARLVHMADVFREEEELWRPRVSRALRRVVRSKGHQLTIDLEGFLGYHKALGRRMLHALWPGLSFQEIERIRALAESSRKGQLTLTGGLQATRRAATLVITKLRKT